MRESKTRLATLIDATQLTQAKFANRTGLSLPYLKKLKASTGDKRSMSKKAAVSISVAFGVDYYWLIGKGRDLPIMARFGQEWTMADAESIQNRKTSKFARAEDASHCVQWFVSNTDRLARIISCGFKSKRAMLCLSRIDSAMSDLMREFKVPSASVKFTFAEWFDGGKWNQSKSPQSITATIAEELIHEMGKEIGQTPEPWAGKSKAKPAKPIHR